MPLSFQVGPRVATGGSCLGLLAAGVPFSARPVSVLSIRLIRVHSSGSVASGSVNDWMSPWHTVPAVGSAPVSRYVSMAPVAQADVPYAVWRKFVLDSSRLLGSSRADSTAST